MNLSGDVRGYRYARLEIGAVTAPGNTARASTPTARSFARSLQSGHSLQKPAERIEARMTRGAGRVSPECFASMSRNGKSASLVVRQFGHVRSGDGMFSRARGALPSTHALPAGRKPGAFCVRKTDMGSTRRVHTGSRRPSHPLVGAARYFGIRSAGQHRIDECVLPYSRSRRNGRCGSRLR